MSIARWVGNVALVGSLFAVAHSDAHAAVKKAYRPMESMRAAERAIVIDWRADTAKGYVINWRAMAKAYKLWLPANFRFYLG